jgi:Fe-S cluster biogenesis protein NfuA
VQEERAWRTQVESIVRTMVQPLTLDGGQFRIESCDPATRQIVVWASISNCEGCAMSDDDLARLLEEAVRRRDPEARLTVVSGPPAS